MRKVELFRKLPWKHIGNALLEGEWLGVPIVANGVFTESVVGETSDTEGWQDTETTCKRHSWHFLPDGSESFGSGGVGLSIEVHGVDVKRSSDDLCCHWDSQGHGELSSVFLNTVLVLEVFSSCRGGVERGIHSGGITCSKESKSTHGCCVLWCRGRELTCKDGVSPRQETDVGHGTGSNLHGLSFLVAFNAVKIQDQLGKVGNSVGSEVNDCSQSERQTTEKLSGGEHHLLGSSGDGLHEFPATGNILYDAFVNDTDKGRNQKRGGSSASNFLGSTLDGIFRKVVAFVTGEQEAAP